MRNLACSGAKALAVTDNLNFGNPNKPEAYLRSKRLCQRFFADACAFFDVPVVGGNAVYNEHGEGK